MILKRVGRNPTHPPFWILQEKNLKTPTVSDQQIKQQVERVTQSIANQLVDHVNQQARSIGG